MPEVQNIAAPVAAEAEAPIKTDVAPEDDPTAGNENIVPGPSTEVVFKVGTEAEVKQPNEKKMAKVMKEGGKRGVEIEGAADMGGLQFFCTMMGQEITEGKVELLIESMKAMNAVSDPSEEERKGGAGKLGKMIFSFAADESKLSAVAYVPKDKMEACSAKEWLAQVVTDIASTKTTEEIVTFEGISERNWAAIQINRSDSLFPIKMRDPAISMAYNFLKKRDLFPEDDDEDDDEFVFGDEDFP